MKVTVLILKEGQIISKLPAPARFILTTLISFGILIAVNYIAAAVQNKEPAFSLIMIAALSVFAGVLELLIPAGKRKQNRENLKNAFTRKNKKKASI